jgi:hypothetical protein
LFVVAGLKRGLIALEPAVGSCHGACRSG